MRGHNIALRNSFEWNMRTDGTRKVLWSTNQILVSGMLSGTSIFVLVANSSNALPVRSLQPQSADGNSASMLITKWECLIAAQLIRCSRWLTFHNLLQRPTLHTLRCERCSKIKGDESLEWSMLWKVLEIVIHFMEIFMRAPCQRLNDKCWARTTSQRLRQQNYNKISELVEHLNRRSQAS